MNFNEYGDMSANYLGAALLESAGLELPSYYKLLLNLQEEYPVINSYTVNSIKNDEKIIYYKMMQYNHLIDKSSNRSLFVDTKSSGR